jgi:hypothetical protein
VLAYFRTDVQFCGFALLPIRERRENGERGIGVFLGIGDGFAIFVVKFLRVRYQAFNCVERKFNDVREFVTAQTRLR